ncbi:MAG: NAD(P)H-hydrate dehydratase [Bacteroidetes bacterium]|nr:NAD(P)H-hydrate dehydratase [Bacteroidota bacterium]
MKIFSANQIRAWDAYTLAHEPLTSLELMNRASGVFTDWLIEYFPDNRLPVYVFVGPGNNGGDGLAVARMLRQALYPVKVFVCTLSDRVSADFAAQRAILPQSVEVVQGFDCLNTGWEGSPQVIIDALFGAGLNRPLEGEWTKLLQFLNQTSIPIVSIDLPSGLMADCASTGACVHATRTFSFETPKLAFFLPENADRVGEWSIASIGLHPGYAQETETPFYYLAEAEIRGIFKKRAKFSHKGSFGHALLLAGSFGKIGAALLAARACLRTGAGLLTVHTAACGYTIIQTGLPEAMCSTSLSPNHVEDFPDLMSYKALGIGPGLGQQPETAEMLKRLLQTVRVPLVLDADALNILAANPDWWTLVPQNAILTPHPGEFVRLFGRTAHDFERLDLLREKAKEHGVFILLKGAHTVIAAPDGTCWFNSTGNPGMATGGSGDVLTGMLTGMLAQGYTPLDACRIAVWAHGRAGDRAAAVLSQEALLAGDLVYYLGKIWQELGRTTGSL